MVRPRGNSQGTGTVTLRNPYPAAKRRAANSPKAQRGSRPNQGHRSMQIPRQWRIPNQMMISRPWKPSRYMPAVTRLQSMPQPKTTRPRITG